MSAFLKFLRENLLSERDVMDVVIKLLTLADRPGSPHEGEVALKQATELAKKHNIDLDVARARMKDQTVRRSASNSSAVHPTDKLYAELSLVLKHVPSMRDGQRYNGASTYQWFGKDVVVWGLSRNYVTVMIILPMNGEREHPTHWYLVLGGIGKYGGYNGDDVLAKGTNAQDVLNAIRSVDWDGIKKKRDQEETDAKNAAYNNAQKLTHEAQEVVDMAIKYGYKLEPASTGMSYRTMYAEPFRLIIGPDGAWWHETRQGGIATDKWKYDTRRFDNKNKGPAALEKWIKTKRKSGEAEFSKHDEVNKLVKVLTHFGFKPGDKQGNQHIWWNQVEKIKVQFGPNKLRGAISKTDEIFWMVSAQYVRNDAPGGGLRPAVDVKAILGQDGWHGKDAVSLEKALSKLMNSAEMGFEKIVAVCQKYGYKPNDKIANRPDSNKEYFASPNGRYWVMVDPKTGQWQFMTTSTVTNDDSLIRKGHTAKELEQTLEHFKGKA